MEESSWPVLAGVHCTLRVLTLADAPDWLAGEDTEQRKWFECPPYAEPVLLRSREGDGARRPLPPERSLRNSA